MGSEKSENMMIFLPLPLLFLSLTGSGYTQATAIPAVQSSLFQCQPSSNQSGQVFTPNIPDFYFNHENAAALSTSREANLTTLENNRRATYIFTIPPVSAQRNCNGTVVAIEYCFKARRSNIRDRFTFLSLVHQRNRSFTVTKSSEIRAYPLESTCTAIQEEDNICCERTQLSIEHLLTSSSYAFAVALRRKRYLQLLKFADSANIYNSEQYQELEIKQAGDNISVGESTRSTNRSLLLLRLIIDPDVLLTTTTTTGTQQMPSEMADAQSRNTSNITFDFTPSSNHTSGVANSMLIGEITGAVAAGGILLLSMLTLIMAIILTRRRAKRNKTITQLPTPSYPQSMEDTDITPNEAYIKSTGAEDVSDYYFIQPTNHAHASDLSGFHKDTCVPMKTNECYGTTTTSMDSDQLYATVEGEHNTSQHGTTTTSMDSDQLYATVEKGHNITRTPQCPMEEEDNYVIP